VRTRTCETSASFFTHEFSFQFSDTQVQRSHDDPPSRQTTTSQQRVVEFRRAIQRVHLNEKQRVSKNVGARGSSLTFSARIEYDGAIFRNHSNSDRLSRPVAAIVLEITTRDVGAPTGKAGAARGKTRNENGKQPRRIHLGETPRLPAVIDKRNFREIT